MSTSQMVEQTFNARTVPNFISSEEADEIHFLSSTSQWWAEAQDPYWNNRTMDAITIYEMYNNILGKYLYDLRDRIGEEIKKQYGIEEPLYPDLMQIVKWPQGFEQQPHADNMTNIDDESVSWFHHRDFGAFLYLNEDFEGGNTYYPEYGVAVRPTAGTLLIHPGGPDHIHGVTKVESGNRFTIATFWTKDKDYFDGWTIDKKETHDQ